jgi:putative endopeptidase
MVKIETLKKKKYFCPVNLKTFEKTFTQKRLSVSQLKQNTKKKKKILVKQLLKKFAPNSIRPENDFYDYINYQWLNDIELEEQQKYITQIDDFRLVQDRVYRELNTIILDYIKTNDNTLAKNLKNYYNSVIRMNSKTYTKKIAAESIQFVDNLIKENNPWKLLAFFNSDEMISNKAPIVWSLNPDETNPKVYISSLDPVQFSILDLNVYYDDGTDKKYKHIYREKYQSYCRKLFSALLQGDAKDFQIGDIYDVQVELFNALGCQQIKESPTEEYIKLQGKELLELGFDWAKFTEELGFKGAPPSHVVISGRNVLKCTTELFLTNWKSDKWRTYWIYILLEKLARITQGWEEIVFEFYGKWERGQSHINNEDAVSSSLYMSVPFNTFLTKQYIAKFENPAAMKYVETLCEELKLVYRKILMRNTWLSPSTKEYALKKLDKFRFIFGNPSQLREDPDLHYGSELYDNMKKIFDWRHRRLIELEGQPLVDIPMMDWGQYPVKMVGRQAYIVNASYTPTENAIYINMGYIQKPFIDLDERGIEYNLAHIGFTIGHEMSHGFDDWGSKYGWDGRLYDWWTADDKAKFKKIQNDVIRQYEEFAKRDGIHFDASIGIGEDLADISGLSICDEYLGDFQENNRDLTPIRSLSYNIFYVYFAYQQRQKVEKSALRAQLKTNPHPLDKYRCNVPLSRSLIFRALYNVKRGDGMWWHNADMVW